MRVYALLLLITLSQALPVPTPDEGEETPRGGWRNALAKRPINQGGKAPDFVATEDGVSLPHISRDSWDPANTQTDNRGGPLPGGDKLVKRRWYDCESDAGKRYDLPPHDGKRDKSSPHDGRRDEVVAGWGADFPTGAGKREDVETDATMIEYALAHKDGPTYQSRSDAADSSNSRRGINPLSGPLHGGATTYPGGSPTSRKRGWCSDWSENIKRVLLGPSEPNEGSSPCTKREAGNSESADIVFSVLDRSKRVVSVPDWDNGLPGRLE